MREVSQQVDVALKCDSTHWRQQNICTPCLYKTADEPPLKFSLLACMDGNNSLKLVDSTFCSGVRQTDDRVSSSAQWIMPEEVDRFKDEVSNAHVLVSLILLSSDIIVCSNTSILTSMQKVYQKIHQ
jgi:hypothetical protein